VSQSPTDKAQNTAPTPMMQQFIEIKSVNMLALATVLQYANKWKAHLKLKKEAQNLL